MKPDPVTTEIVRNSLIHIADEMKVTIHKTAFSSTIQETQDYSIALFEDTDVLAFAYGIPAHVGALPLAVRLVLKDYEKESLSNDDVILWNLPSYGGSHTCDVTCMKCVLIDDLKFFPMVRAHWSDIGGMSPGSISGEATEVFQEGLLLPPVKIVEGNKLNKELFKAIMGNMRLPLQRNGDLRAQIAACDVGEDRLRALCDKYGSGIVKSSIRQFLDQDERRSRETIKKIPSGSYEYEDYLDSDGHDPEPYRIHVNCEVKGDSMTVDFDGTSAQAKGPTNSSLATTESGVFVSLKCMLDPLWPLNQGFFRPISIRAPEGTIVNCSPTAPTGSVWEVCCRITDVMIGALAGVAERIAAPGLGAINHTHMGGMHPKTGQPYVWYEAPKAGAGGTDRGDGEDSLCHIGIDGDTKDFAVERAELEFPLRLEVYQNRFDSAGPGKHRGGLGIRRDYRVLDRGRGVSSLWDRCKIPPFGLFGGFGGAPQRIYIYKKDGVLDPFPVELGCKVTEKRIDYGDVLSLQSNGGGGYGDPLERDPNSVLSDLRRKVISEDTAKDIYGVIVDTNGWTVDEQSTVEQRKRLENSRIYCRCVLKNEEFFGRRRTARIHSETLRRLGVPKDEPIEILGKAAAPLRFWSKIDESFSEAEVGVDQSAMRILRVRQGDKVWLRDPNLLFRKYM